LHNRTTDAEPIDVDRGIERFASMKNRLLLWFNRLNSDFSGYITLGARASCDRSEDMTRRLWSHEHPASLWWVQYLNSVCDWSKFMWVFSLVNRRSLVNQWKGSHKFRYPKMWVQIPLEPTNFSLVDCSVRLIWNITYIILHLKFTVYMQYIKSYTIAFSFLYNTPIHLWIGKQWCFVFPCLTLEKLNYTKYFTWQYLIINLNHGSFQKIFHNFLIEKIM
jgi:hypothetical protein